MKIRNFFEFFRYNRKPWIRNYKEVVTVSSMSSIPSGKLERTIYLISRDGNSRWLVLDCPRGHDKRIEVNLMRSVFPYWRLVEKKGKVSLFPSIAVESSECSCHFWLENNIAREAFWN